MIDIYLGLYGEKDSKNFLSYALNNQYKRFKADIALSERTKDTKNIAVLSVYGDDVLLYTKDIEAGTLIESIDIDVTGVVKLQIETQNKQVKDYWNSIFVILGNPRIMK